MGFHPSVRANRFDLRSNMIDGAPRPAAAMSAGEQKVAEPGPAHVLGD